MTTAVASPLSMAHLRLLRHHSLHCNYNLSLLRLISPFSSSSPPIEPVGYPVKSKDPSEEEITQNQEQTQELSPSSSDPSANPDDPRVQQWPEASRTWTREEARFVKDTPVITPVRILLLISTGNYLPRPVISSIRT